jgi:hypothetical protein
MMQLQNRALEQRLRRRSSSRMSIHDVPFLGSDCQGPFPPDHPETRHRGRALRLSGRRQAKLFKPQVNGSHQG